MNHPLSIFNLSWGIAANPTAGDKRPRGRGLAPISISSPHGWMTYQEAVEESARHPGSAIGARLHDGCGVAVIDIDKGHPHDPMKTVRWFDSYAERSSSGQGVHIFVRTRWNGGARNAAEAVEVYSRDRFIICTGDTIHDRPVVPATDKVERLVARLKGGVAAAGQAAAASPQFLAMPTTISEELKARARAVVKQVWSNEEVRQLWRGEWQAIGFPSQSEADASLLERLAFMSDDDEAILAAFRLSGLGQREKARRGDYAPRTLAFIRQRKASVPAVDMSGLGVKEPAAEPAPASQKDAIIEKLLKQIADLTQQVANLSAQLEAARNPVPAPAPSVETAPLVNGHAIDEASDIPFGGVAEHIDYEDHAFDAAMPKQLGEIVRDLRPHLPKTNVDFVVASLAAAASGLAARCVSNYNGAFGTSVHSLLVGAPGAGKSVSSAIVGMFSSFNPAAAVMASTIGGRAAVMKLRSQIEAGVLHWSEAGTDINRLADDSTGSVGFRQIVQMFDRSPTSPAEMALTVGGSTIPAHYYLSTVSDTQPLYLKALLSRDSAGSGILSRLTCVIDDPRIQRVHGAGMGGAPSGRLGQLLQTIASMPERARGSDSPVYTPARIDDAAKILMERDATHWSRVIGGYKNAGRNTAADYCARMNARAERLAIALAVLCSPHSPMVTEEIAAYAIRFVNRHYLLIREELLQADRTAASIASERLHMALEILSGETGGVISGPDMLRCMQADASLIEAMTLVGRGDEMRGLSSVLRSMTNETYMLKRIKIGGMNGTVGYSLLTPFDQKLYKR